MKSLKLIALILSLSLSGAAYAQTPANNTAMTPSAKSATAPKGDLLDINTATADQLAALPGIGKAYSAKIIAGRPYQRKTELLKNNILPEAVYNGIKDKIIAHRPKTAAGAMSTTTAPAPTK